jgi:hypothetical protein
MFIGLILVPLTLAATQTRATLGGSRSLMIYESTPPENLVLECIASIVLPWVNMLTERIQEGG